MLKSPVMVAAEERKELVIEEDRESFRMTGRRWRTIDIED